MTDKQKFTELFKKHCVPDNYKGWTYRYLNGFNDPYENRKTGDYTWILFHESNLQIVLKKGRTEDHHKTKHDLWDKYAKWAKEIKADVEKS